MGASMRIRDFDEYPFHQNPTPFDIPATSDVHFNDGYFCSTFAGDWYVVAGIRLHPNMNVMDGFAGVARRGEQLVLRTSRALRPRSHDLEVGPLRIEIRRPLQEILITLAENEGGFGFELTFEAVAPPFMEEPYRFRKYGHLIHDLVRYTQVCRATGRVVCDGHAEAANRWHAIRDHSWGIRSGMGPPTPHGGIERDESEIDRRRFRLWVPFEVQGHSGFFNTHEAEDGTTLDFEGRLDFPDGTQAKLVAVRHHLEYAPGTKNVVGGTFALLDLTGTWREYRIDAAGTPADVQGLGYYGGWRDGGSAGVYRGVGPIVEVDRYPSASALGKTGLLSLPEAKRLGPTEFPCFLVGPDGARGMAHVEQHVLGHYKPYGF